LTPPAPVTRVFSSVNTNQSDTLNTKETAVNGRSAITEYSGNGTNGNHSVTASTGPRGTLTYTIDSDTTTQHVMPAGVPDEIITTNEIEWIQGNDPVTGQYYNQPYKEYLKSQAQDNRDWFAAISDFSAAVADKVSGGLTKNIRQGLGYDDAVNYNSRAYSNGAVVGEVLDTAIQFIPACKAVGLARAGIRAINGAQALGNTIEAANSLAQGDVIGGMSSLLSARSSFGNMLRSCFTAGTPLLTPEGSKPIEQFQAGDLVLSREEDDPTSPVLARHVLQVFVRVAPILNLYVGGRIIGTTGEHPFYVKGKGWTAAGELRTGDILLSHDGWEIPIEGIEDTRRIETVYNMEVEEDHTYFVGCAEWGWNVWSHNAPPCLPILRPAVHGGPLHNSTMVREALAASRRPGVTAVRTNQVLADAAGRTIKNLRPDVQYIKRGLVHVTEVNVSRGPGYHRAREKQLRAALGSLFGSYTPR
jgi:hypothetical protein